MILVVKVKDTENIIGLKECVSTLLEQIADVERIDVFEDNEIHIKVKELRAWQNSK